MYKFALVGTSCVGKTTLLEKLEEELKTMFPRKTIVTVEEAARLYFSTHKAKNPFSFFHQTRIQNLVHKQEQQIMKKNPDLVISDRSVIDAIVYIGAMGDRLRTKKLLKKMRHWIATYTHFFLLDPKHIPYQTDNIRKEKRDLRGKFHDAFLYFFSSSHLPYSIISDKTIDERLSKIIKTIEKNLS